VLVDNLAYRLKEPLRGQEVVTEQAEGHDAGGRVVGLPGDLVQLRGDELLVNDSPLPRFVLEDSHSEQALAEEIGLSSRRLLIEENDAQRYVIATRPGPPPQDTPALTVEEDQVLVTSDNRVQPGKLALRRVSKDRILGKPRYILYSGTQPELGQEAQARWDRVGLRLQ
jgi:signal peptidase I